MSMQSIMCVVVLIVDCSIAAIFFVVHALLNCMAVIHLANSIKIYIPESTLKGAWH